MTSDTPPIAEQGVATLPEAVWAQARRRTEIIGPLAALEVVGHEAADAAAQLLGLSRRQVYVLIRRARQGVGLVTDLAPSRSGGGKGKGRLPEPVERITTSWPATASTAGNSSTCCAFSATSCASRWSASAHATPTWPSVRTISWRTASSR
jgi:hypothetical protein